MILPDTNVVAELSATARGRHFHRNSRCLHCSHRHQPRHDVATRYSLPFEAAGAVVINPWAN